MKKQYSFSLIIACIGLFQSAIGQHVPETSIPISAVRNMLGVGPTENFTLVYKGDTLASQFIDGDVSKSKFFDEHITCINFGDSLEFQYSLPYGYGIHRVKPIDSTTIYRKVTFGHSPPDITDVYRYDESGEGVYWEEIFMGKRVITRYKGDGSLTTTITADGWSESYIQSEPDSSYITDYTPDSTFVGYSFNVKLPTGEQLGITEQVQPYSYRSTRSFNSIDSNYSYSLNVWKRDTSITDFISHRFPDLDSIYKCNSGISDQGEVYTKQYVHVSSGDSLYRYSSLNGGSISWMIENDSVKISKDYDLSGKLIERRRLEFLFDGSEMAEVLIMRDTFRHFIMYYHNLNWKDDTMHVTSYFPYSRQVYLNDDSVVTKELNYSFERKGDWPVVTIKENDSTWVENISDGESSKFAEDIYIPSSSISVDSISVDVNNIPVDSLQFKGMGGTHLREWFMGVADQKVANHEWVGSSPYYVAYFTEDQEPVSTFRGYWGKSDAECDEMMKNAKKTKATLYVDGKPRKVKGVLLRLDITYEY